MPFTPFHFGPGAALHALAPRHVSFVAFCGVNVLIDVETLVNMLTGRHPLHAFFHTWIGATLAATAATLLLSGLCRLGRRWRLPNPFGWRELRLKPIAIGAFSGAWTHVVLDSIMHGDIVPFAPFSQANGLFRIVPLDALHAGCAVAGAVALVVLLWRDARRE